VRGPKHLGILGEFDGLREPDSNRQAPFGAEVSLQEPPRLPFCAAPVPPVFQQVGFQLDVLRCY
jgi:hypothetical protein